MSIIFYIFIAILILMFMITVHEVGHYVAGKILGFKINEFSIGFGKALFKRTNKKTGEVFAVRFVPLGGYCAFEGEDKDSQSPDAFNKQAPWKRLIVLFSGAFFNFLCAILFSVVLLMITGYYQAIAYNSIDPKTNSSLQENDIIHAISVNGKDFEYFTLLNSFTSVISNCNENDEIVLKIERNGNIQDTESFHLAKLTDENGGSYIGIGISGAHTVYQPLGFFEALGKSFVFCFELAWMILALLWKMVTGKISMSGVGGPVATISVMTQSVSNSLLNIFILVPLISVNLAVFNLLPIPALDGARMVFVGIEWVRGKPVNPQLEGRIHMIGLIVLFSFVIFADFNYLLGGISKFLLNCSLRL